MPDAVVIVIMGVLSFAVGYAGWLAGRDAAERGAYATISSLRQDLTRTRLECARLREHNDRLRHRNQVPPDVQLPEWMS